MRPRLGEANGLPKSVEDAAAFLKERIPATRSRSARALAENWKESALAHATAKIAKLRFSDYRRTLRRR